MTRRSAIVALSLALVFPVRAHTLDEYLQATLVAVGADRVDVSMRLVPGVAVWPQVLASIDLDADGEISAAESRVYAARVLDDLTLAVDGKTLAPALTELSFAPIAQLEEGLGVIRIAFGARVPVHGSEHAFVFENHHYAAISAYIVNALVPDDASIRIVGQVRDTAQARYELRYLQTPIGSALGASPALRFEPPSKRNALWLAAALGMLSVACWHGWRRRA